MRRKKPPVALVSVLVMSVLGLVIASGSWKFYNQSAEDQMKQLQQEEMDKMRAKGPEKSPDPAKSDTKKEVAGLRESMKAGGASKGGDDDEASGAMTPNKKAPIPTVIMPDQTTVKPTKNASSPSSQWYR